MFNPDLDFSPIPDPGVKKAPDPGFGSANTARNDLQAKRIERDGVT
jgi:hypothetical protein